MSLTTEELDELVKRWGLLSAGYELGYEVPTRSTGFGEFGDPDTRVDLTSDELEHCQDLLSDVISLLNNFTLLCKSKLRPENHQDFNHNLPTNCAKLVKDILEGRQFPRPLRAPNPFMGTSSILESDDDDPITVAIHNFLETISRKEATPIRLHNCGLQYCTLKGCPSPRTSPDRSETCLADFSFQPLRPETPGPLSQRPISPVENVSPLPEEIIEENFLRLGARPRKIRSRKWLRKE